MCPSFLIDICRSLREFLRVYVVVLWPVRLRNALTDFVPTKSRMYSTVTIKQLFDVIPEMLVITTLDGDGNVTEAVNCALTLDSWVTNNAPSDELPSRGPRPAEVAGDIASGTVVPEGDQIP